MDRYPAAYARKSHKDQASADAQLAAIREIARADGANSDLHEYKDVGRSGRFGKRGTGSDWQRLQDDITADRVSTVYLSVLDRAGRSLEEWLTFTRLCVEHDTRVVDKSGERTREGFDLAVIEMLFSDKEGRKAVERSARASATMLSRRYKIGHAPYGYRVAWEVGGESLDRKPDGRSDVRRLFVENPDEPVAPLADAVRETRGNVLAAARLLNQRGILNRGREWHPRSLSRVLDRQRLNRTRRGTVRRRAPSLAPLSRLVECHCGQLMTPTRDRRTSEWTEMYCSVGHRQGVAVHGRYVARSRPVYDLLRAETDGRREVKEKTTYTTDQSGLTERKASLEEELRRLGKAYLAGAVDDDEFDSETRRIRSDLDVIAEDLASTDDSISLTFTKHGPLVHWDALETDPTRVGDELRQLVREVRLDAEMKPVAIEWRRAVQPFTPAKVRPHRP